MPTAIGTYSCRKDCCACSSLLKFGRLPDLSLSCELYTRSSRSSAKLQHTCRSEKESHLCERLTKITLHRCQSALVVALTPCCDQGVACATVSLCLRTVQRTLFSCILLSSSLSCLELKRFVASRRCSPEGLQYKLQKTYGAASIAGCELASSACCKESKIGGVAPLEQLFGLLYRAETKQVQKCSA